MYYYCKKSSRKIIHKVECAYISSIDINDIGWFESLTEAYEHGYRLCKHCSPLFKHYKNERDKILEYCQNRGLSVWLGDKGISIHSLKSRWKIALDDKDHMILYHKNDFETSRDYLSEIKGYHYQGDVRCDRIVEYLEYIVEHDRYRLNNPVYVPKKKKEHSLPKKGTKRYKKAQKKLEKHKRIQAIKNVISLIDSISVSPCL